MPSGAPLLLPSKVIPAYVIERAVAAAARAAGSPESSRDSRARQVRTCECECECECEWAGTGEGTCTRTATLALAVVAPLSLLRSACCAVTQRAETGAKGAYRRYNAQAHAHAPRRVRAG